MAERSIRAASGVKILLLMITMLLALEVLLRIGYPLYADYYSDNWLYSRDVKEIVDQDPVIFDHRPLAGFSGQHYAIATNSHGMRDREYTLDRTPDVFRIAVVGDSTSLGWGVSENEVFTEILESRLTENLDEPVEVLNFGVGNYNTVQEQHKIDNQVIQFNPDMLLLQYYINDVESTAPANWLSLRRHSYTYFMFWRIWLTLRMTASPPDLSIHYASLYSEDNPAFTENRDALVEISRIASSQNIDLYVVLIPELSTLDPELSDLQRKYVSGAIGGSATILDLHTVFAGNDPESFHVSSQDHHLNEKGHRMIADALTTPLAGAITEWTATR